MSKLLPIEIKKELERIESKTTMLKERENVFRVLSAHVNNPHQNFLYRHDSDSLAFSVDIKDPDTGKVTGEKIDMSHILGALKFSIENAEDYINNYKSKCIKTLVAVNDVISSSILEADKSDDPDEMKKLFHRLNDTLENL